MLLGFSPRERRCPAGGEIMRRRRARGREGRQPRGTHGWRGRSRPRSHDPPTRKRGDC